MIFLFACNMATPGAEPGLELIILSLTHHLHCTT